jgi:hypothetical protein
VRQIEPRRFPCSKVRQPRVPQFAVPEESARRARAPPEDGWFRLRRAIPAVPDRSRHGSRRIEDVARGPQGSACVHDASLTPQPFTVGQQQSPAQERPVLCDGAEAVLEERLRAGRRGKQGLGVAEIIRTHGTAMGAERRSTSAMNEPDEIVRISKSGTSIRNPSGENG